MSEQSSNSSLSQEEAQKLYNQLNENKKAREKSEAYKCFGIAAAVFVIGSIFQMMVDSSMFSFTIRTSSIILKTLASFTFYVGWAVVAIGIYLGIVGLKRSTQDFSRIDITRMRNDAAALQDTSPEEAKQKLNAANAIEILLNTLNS